MAHANRVSAGPSDQRPVLSDDRYLRQHRYTSVASVGDSYDNALTRHREASHGGSKASVTRCFALVLSMETVFQVTASPTRT